MIEKNKVVINNLKKLGIYQPQIVHSKLFGKPLVIYEDDTSINNKNSKLWAKLFDHQYEKIITKDNPIEDTSVWKSSYTKDFIPKNEIIDWANGFVKKIDRYLNKDTSILEIGCGNGLILNKVISRVKNYTGVDNSFFAIESIKKSPVFESIKHKIKLHHCDASEIQNIDGNDYDLIILNSVVQYFPSVEYLLNFLLSLKFKLRSSAVIAIGDIRSYHTSNLHYYEKIKSKQNEKSFGASLKKKIDFLKDTEKETLFSPIFFKTLHLLFDWISSVSITSKSSIYLNEMTKYRYDVLIFCNEFKRVREKSSNNLIQVKNSDLISDPKKYLKSSNNKSIICKDMPNIYIQNTYINYLNDLRSEQIEDNWIKSYDAFMEFRNYYLTSDLFYDFFEYGNLNEMYFFASSDENSLSYNLSTKNFDLFKLSNRLSNRSPILLLDFFNKTSRTERLLTEKFPNYYIFKIQKLLMMLFKINQ